MKNILFILILLFFFNCSKDNLEKTCELNMDYYDYSFGINYNTPDDYLSPGDQSDLDNAYTEEIRNTIGTPELTIAGIQTVTDWFNQNFTFSNAGGNMIGKKTIDELYESKTVYGCHSAALVISSVLREFGFPALMIETASIQWAYDYNAEIAEGFAGHVMTEVFVEDKWILLDNNGSYLDNYDCMNPYISTADQYYNNNEQGLFTYAKGVDIWAYGVYSEADTHEKMIEFADNLVCFEEQFGSVNYSWSN